MADELKDQDSNRVAIAYIVDEKDNILMGKRNDNELYTTPGGHIKVGECPFQGLARELEEEAGLEAVTIDLDKVGKKDGKLLYLFTVTVDSNQRIDSSNDPDNEVTNWHYIDPNEVKEELHVPLEDNWVLRKWMGSPVSGPMVAPLGETTGIPNGAGGTTGIPSGGEVGLPINTPI